MSCLICVYLVVLKWTALLPLLSQHVMSKESTNHLGVNSGDDEIESLFARPVPVFVFSHYPLPKMLWPNKLIEI